jgi:hypothetical protein
VACNQHTPITCVDKRWIIFDPDIISGRNTI